MVTSKNIEATIIAEAGLGLLLGGGRDLGSFGKGGGGECGGGSGSVASGLCGNSSNRSYRTAPPSMR